MFQGGVHYLFLLNQNWWTTGGKQNNFTLFEADTKMAAFLASYLSPNKFITSVTEM